MTVHGAKGLEAPIVILADTTTPPQGFHPPRLLQLPAGGAAPPLVWAVAKANDVGPMAAAREAALDEARDEYRRLLYVAMTRAIERLIVCGVDGVNKRPEGCWYDLARGALEGQCVAEAGRRRRQAMCCATARCRTPPPRQRPPRKRPATTSTLPGWLKETFADAARVAAPIKPSGFVDDPNHGWSVAAARGAAARDSPRQHRAPADAVAARHPAGSQARRRAPIHRPAENGFQPTPNATRSSSRHWRF